VRQLAAEAIGQREPVNDVNYIFPSYIVDRLRGGLAGLILAVIFAAAMSALAGELNSLATTTMVDFYSRFVRVGRGHDLLVSRLFTVFWGLFAALVASQAGQLGSAIVVVNRFGSYFYGSILGVFGLAVLTPRASARGAFYGLFAGMAAVFLVSWLTPVAFLWYNVVGAVTVFATGLLITALAPGPAPGPSASS
jgi:Na+/proline symporter